jgi:hypothetical protein
MANFMARQRGGRRMSDTATLTAPAAEDTHERQFTIFRGATAPTLVLDDTTGLTEVSGAGLMGFRDAGIGPNGADTRVIFEAPGFSLVYAWFKSGFPLPRHSHKMDCAYYIVGGSLQLGPDILGKGDGFFVPANAPYTYTVGPEGVEVLEVRQEACHDIHIMANNSAFWRKAIEAAPASLERWSQEPRPSPTLAEKTAVS